MARRFNGTSDFIVFTLPASLQSVVAGSTTLVCVANFTDGTDGAMVHARTSGGTNSWWMETAGNVWNYGQGVTAKNVGGQTNGSWAAYIGRKTTGGANAPRGRKIIFGGATTDTTAGTGLADGTAPGAGGILQVGKWGTASEFINADIAAVAVFNSDLSDGTTATFTTWQAILDAAPVWAVHFDQANATDAITDATGNGGNSSTITGTTIVSNPSGFFASGVTVNAESAAVTAAANSATLASAPQGGNAAVAAAANSATLAPKPSAGNAAVGAAAAGASLQLSAAAGNVAVGAASGNVTLTSAPAASSSAVSVAALSAGVASSFSSGFAAVAVGAADMTLTIAGATPLPVTGGAVAVGAFDVTLLGGDQGGGEGGAVTGGWQGLLDVLNDIRATLEEERAAPLTACPVDGEPLQSARGVMHCRYCGRQYIGNEQL